MSVDQRQQRSQWISGGLFFAVAVALLGFHLWFVFFPLAEQKSLLAAEQQQLEELKRQQQEILTPDIRDLVDRYTQTISAIQVAFGARDAVFSGALEEENKEPVMILDYEAFFEELKKVLNNKVVLTNLSISPGGRVNFLAQTTSYFQAAQQMTAFRFGFEEALKRDQEPVDPESDEGIILDELGPEPELITDFSVTSVARQEVVGEQDKLPVLFQSSSEIYGFLVQFRINPAYYAYQVEKEGVMEDLKDVEDSEDAEDSEDTEDTEDAQDAEDAEDGEDGEDGDPSPLPSDSNSSSEGQEAVNS